MGTTEVGNTLGGKSGKMGGIGMGVYTGMGRRQNRWIPIHYIEQGPDLKDRLTIVLEFMNNPEVTLDPLKVPIQLDNVWLNSAKELHIKKLNRFTLTATEETFLKKYKGFMYAKFLKDFHRVIVGRRYQSTMVTSELFIHQTWMSSHLRYCIYCTVIHPYREKDHPQKAVFII